MRQKNKYISRNQLEVQQNKVFVIWTVLLIIKKYNNCLLIELLALHHHLIPKRRWTLADMWQYWGCSPQCVTLTFPPTTSTSTRWVNCRRVRPARRRDDSKGQSQSTWWKYGLGPGPLGSSGTGSSCLRNWRLSTWRMRHLPAARPQHPPGASPSTRPTITTQWVNGRISETQCFTY